MNKKALSFLIILLMIISVFLSSCGYSTGDISTLPKDTLLYDYYDRVVGTPIEMGRTEYIIYTYDDNNLRLDYIMQGDALTEDDTLPPEEITSYKIPKSIITKLTDIINKYNMTKWNDKNYPGITGRAYRFMYYKDGEMLISSSDSMPEDGNKIFSEIEMTICNYITDENKMQI